MIRLTYNTSFKQIFLNAIVLYFYWSNQFKNKIKNYKFDIKNLNLNNFKCNSSVVSTLSTQILM